MYFNSRYFLKVNEIILSDKFTPTSPEASNALEVSHHENTTISGNSGNDDAWVYFTSIPQSEAVSIGLLLGSQGIIYIPSCEGPNQALLSLNQDDPGEMEKINQEIANIGDFPPNYTPPKQFLTPYHQKHGENKIALYLRRRHLYHAHNQLFLWHQENVDSNKPKDDITPIPELSLAPLSILLIPVFFYFALPLTGNYPYLKEQGLNSAQAVLRDGEWWRLWTALTLHSDHKHLISNLISGYFVLNLLRTRFNTLKQLITLTLVSGIANFFVVYTHGYDVYGDHRSLGFSTFVFAVLGMLAAVETRLIWKDKDFKFKRFTPFTSAFFIVIMMGLGEGTDILAHVYGFFFGLIPGLLTPLRKTNFNPHFKNNTPSINASSTNSISIIQLVTWALGVSWYFLCWKLIIV